MKIEDRGIKHFYNDDGKRPFRKLAFADVYLPELSMHIRDVTLTWSGKDGFVALAPLAETGSNARAVTWHHQSDFGRKLGETVANAWRGIGGQIPSEPTAKQQNGINAARRHAEKHKPEPIERRVFPATSTVHEEANDNEAVEGLHRTLGIEHQEAERACG